MLTKIDVVRKLIRCWHDGRYRSDGSNDVVNLTDRSNLRLARGAKRKGDEYFSH